MVPEEAAAFYGQKATEGAAAEGEWAELFARYSAAHPDLAAEFQRRVSGELPLGWKEKLPVYFANVSTTFIALRSLSVC